MTAPLPAVVSTEWLAKHLREPDLRVLDGTWHMPQLKRDARAEFAQAHIPGAVFFDIDHVADRTTSLPHMLPAAEAFAEAVGALGVGSGDRVVVYDVRGVISAARVWWTFRVFGHDRVAVLDGGLRAWKADGRPLETGEPTPPRRPFRATLRPELVRDLDAMRRNLSTRGEQVLDARSRGRFEGAEPEPRAGLRGGHIPGSLNLPYETLYRPDGTLLSPDGLRAALIASGADLGKPTVTTCGSGVTASVLALALHLVGHPHAAVYDGSWTEWGGRTDTDVNVGGPDMAPHDQRRHALMATTETYTLQAFIEDLDRITREETSGERITERAAPLLGRLVQHPSSIPPEFLKSTAQSRGRYMLHRAPRFNVTSVIWRPGDTAGAHNHQTWGVIGVIDNEIEETRYRVSETGTGTARLEVTSVTRHTRGAVSRLIPGDEVHRMHNPTERDTVEIHVYGKDLVDLQRTMWSDDGTEKPLVSAKYLNC